MINKIERIQQGTDSFGDPCIFFYSGEHFFKFVFYASMTNHRTFYPSYIKHLNNKGKCPLCQNNSGEMTCVEDSFTLNSFFLEIIEQPEIRLEWLYISYTLKSS